MDTTSTCAICLEDACDESIDCAHCPGLVCVPCYRRHLEVTMTSTLHGMLPIVRCPMCLTHLTKKAWRKHATNEVVLLFEQLCAKSCAFISPCCHNEDYSHLPRQYEGVWPPLEDLVDTYAAALIRRHVKQFVHHQISARATIAFLETQPTECGCEELLDIILPRIHDDERRATLLLAYAAKYKQIFTRCCGTAMCFVCQRLWYNHSDDSNKPCDELELLDSQLLQCRQCGVTIVKSEGCNTVVCICGYKMLWSQELTIAGEYARKLIPVDIRDLKLFAVWDEWRYAIVALVEHGHKLVRAKWRLQEVGRGILAHHGVLQRLLQMYIWRKRFSRQLLQMEMEIAAVRLHTLVTQLRKQGALGLAIRRKLPLQRWRHRFRLRLPAMEKEINATRLRMLTIKLQRHGALGRALRQRRRHTRWRLCMRDLLRAAPLYDEEDCELSGSVDMFEW